MDSLADSSLQDIAGLAALACDTPFASLTLGGADVAWYRAGARMERGAWPAHNPFSVYAVQCSELFEVPDASRDERFAGAALALDGCPVCAYAGAPMRDSHGSLVGMIAVLDTSPRRLSATQRAALRGLAQHGAGQLALGEELTVARARLESAPVAIYHTDVRGQITYANPEYRRFLGLGPTESLENWINIVHADDRSRMQAIWADFCLNPRPLAFEYRTAPREGASRVLTEQVVAAPGTGFVGTITDITDRVEAGEHLKRAETLSHHTFEQAPIGIVYTDRKGRVLRANQSFCDLLGFNTREIETTSIAELTHDADVASNAAEFERLWRGETDVIDLEMRYVHADRRAMWVRVTTALVRDASGEPTCAVKFIRDISARRDLAAALTQNQQLLQAVLADLPVAVRACDVDGRIFLHNSAAGELFAIGAAGENLPAVEVFLPDGKTPVPSEERLLPRALRGETATNVELVMARPGHPARTTLGSARRLTGPNGECLGAVAVTQDVTEKRKLERELANAHKLESIGQLAAGIAHEINTPTQFIGDNIRFLQESVGEVLEIVERWIALGATTGEAADPAEEITALIGTADMRYLREEVPKALMQSLDGVERIAKIVGAMKEFSHPALDKVPHDLNRAIASTITVATNEWKYVADVKTDFDADLPFVPVMPGAFNQVILNMLVNAAHAIGAIVAEAPGTKGLITVSTRKIAQCAEIRIHDSGCGIPEDIRDRIFDPFFTTKEVGRGTGQGLAIAHDVIVNKHKGSIAIEVEQQIGTTFIVRLPIDAPLDATSGTSDAKQAAA